LFAWDLKLGALCEFLPKAEGEHRERPARRKPPSGGLPEGNPTPAFALKNRRFKSERLKTKLFSCLPRYESHGNG
jgi:hypothetical protein